MQGFRYGTSEEINNLIENLLEDTESTMHDLGLELDCNESGIWPVCSRCRVYLPVTCLL